MFVDELPRNTLGKVVKADVTSCSDVLRVIPARCSYGAPCPSRRSPTRSTVPPPIITLNRPEQLNAFTGTMLEELLVAFDQADADDAVRAVIMTGAGRVFCAGADLSSGGDTFNADARGRTTETPRAPRDGGGILVLRIFDCTKPVIGAINGSAVGVGISMTLPMDIRILADNAKVGFVFTGRGIAPDGAASWFLPRVVGINQALEWVLTARVFRAQEALDGGLVRSIHPADEVLDVAKALAAEIATNAAPVSASVSRGLLWRMLGEGHPMAAHRADSEAIFDLGRKPDAREGVMAFLEKREPAWTLSPTKDLPPTYPWWDYPDLLKATEASLATRSTRLSVPCAARSGPRSTATTLAAVGGEAAPRWRTRSHALTHRSQWGNGSATASRHDERRTCATGVPRRAPTPSNANWSTKEPRAISGLQG